jgi:hypothetical protein
MPETLRSLVGDGSIPPPPLSMSPPMLWHRRQMKRELAKTGGEKEHVERPPRIHVSQDESLATTRNLLDHADSQVSTTIRFLDTDARGDHLDFHLYVFIVYGVLLCSVSTSIVSWNAADYIGLSIQQP